LNPGEAGYLVVGTPSFLKIAAAVDAQSAPRRSPKWAGAWQHDLTQGWAYLGGRAKTPEERALSDQAFEEVLSEGPNFTHYRGKSDFRKRPG
jgi:hypothetical protein